MQPSGHGPMPAAADWCRCCSCSCSCSCFFRLTVHQPDLTHRAFPPPAEVDLTGILKGRRQTVDGAGVRPVSRGGPPESRLSGSGTKENRQIQIARPRSSRLGIGTGKWQTRARTEFVYRGHSPSVFCFVSRGNTTISLSCPELLSSGHLVHTSLSTETRIISAYAHEMCS
jgi:hypothetical protein